MVIVDQSTATPAVEEPTGASKGPVILDIGGAVGAVVILTGADLDGTEVEVRRLGPNGTEPMWPCALVRPQVSLSTLPSSDSCTRGFTNFGADRPSPSNRFTESRLSVGEWSNSTGEVDPSRSLCRPCDREVGGRRPVAGRGFRGQGDVIQLHVPRRSECGSS